MKEVKGDEVLVTIEGHEWVSTPSWPLFKHSLKTVAVFVESDNGSIRGTRILGNFRKFGRKTL